MTDPITVRYVPVEESGPAGSLLIVNPGTPHERSLPFFGRVEIGRDHQQPSIPKGKILVDDRAVSGRHCIVTQNADGRCFVRDVSRNGTRIDGRRLVPNVESEILPGQTLKVGLATEFLFQTAPDTQPFDLASVDSTEGTMRLQLEPIEVTVLVGDIRGYTRLVQNAPSRALQDSVGRVFQALEEEIRRYGGMLKEYQGDAIFAYWESDPNPEHAADACRAALALSRLVPVLGSDPAVWNLADFPLGMDWCLASGDVVVETVGGASPTGLSMIGEPVVLAFRLEKLASDDNGHIIVAESTWRAARHALRFVDRGEAEVAGFEAPQRFFELAADLLDETTPL
jgi:class 3 adenylate cyclase